MVGGENCSQIVRFLHVIRHALWLQFGFWRQLPFTYTLLGLVQLVPTDDESNFQRRIVLENLFFLSFAQKYLRIICVSSVLDEGSAGDSAPGGKTNEESDVDSQVRETTKIDDDHSDALVSVGDKHVRGSNGQLETYSIVLEGIQSRIACTKCMR